MFYKVREVLEEINVNSDNLSIETLYKVGMDSVRNNIEFYFDKPYTCESVIKNLFIQGIKDFLKNK